MSWWVLFALLFIQIKVAVGGCLILDVLPPSQPTEQAMQMNTTGDPCTEHSSQGQKLCMKHCSQNSDALKLTFDLPIFAPAILPSSLPLFTVADVVGLETPEQPTATTGPPPYLRFLRLLN